MGRFVFTLAVGVWLGALVSFSYVFLPTVHATLTGSDLRALLQRLFPRYYSIGIVCGLMALACVSLTPSSPSLPLGERLRLAIPVALALLCTLATRQFLLPRLAKLESSSEPAYARLHQVAAMLNTTTLAMLVLVLAAAVTR
jgi:hypothetical protein